jgi:hypothetical protein
MEKKTKKLILDISAGLVLLIITLSVGAAILSGQQAQINAACGMDYYNCASTIPCCGNQHFADEMRECAKLALPTCPTTTSNTFFECACGINTPQWLPTIGAISILGIFIMFLMGIVVEFFGKKKVRKSK